MTRIDDSSSNAIDAADGEPKPISKSSRRALLGSGAALTITGLSAGAFVRNGAASDDHEDHSGPGGDGDDDHDDTDDDRHGLPPNQSTQVVGITTVRIVNERFEPNNILIETGQSVRWQNLDDDQHTASGRRMDTGVINPGGQGQVTFLESGEFEYTCSFHPDMLGLVTVVGESRATPVASPEASPVAISDEVEVSIVDFAFEPETATAAVGGAVSWTNTGEAPHSVYATWALSDILNTGDSYSHRFDTIGTYEYQCGLHPAMTGTIQVVAAQSAADATPESGDASDPVGVWLFIVEVDDMDLFPFTDGMIKIGEDERASCVFMTVQVPQPFFASGRWHVEAGAGVAFDANGHFNREGDAGFKVASIQFRDLAIQGDAMEGTVAVGITNEEGTISRTAGTANAVRL